MREIREKIRIWGLVGLGGGGSFIVSFKKRVAQKLRRIILLHFRPRTFDFIPGEPANQTFSWFSDFGTCPWAPKPIIFKFVNTVLLQIIQENLNHFWKIWCLELSTSLTSKVLSISEKVGAEQSWRFVLYLFEKLEFEINSQPTTWS